LPTDFQELSFTSPLTPQNAALYNENKQKLKKMPASVETGAGISF